MSDTASKSYVDSEILKHENKGVARTNKIKDDLSNIIQKDRHDSKNRDQSLGYDISENKEQIALHNQHRTFMEEKVGKIEEHVEKGIAEIKQIIKEQASTFATKAEHKENQKSINWIIKILWTFGVAIILGGGAFIWNFLITK